MTPHRTLLSLEAQRSCMEFARPNLLRTAQGLTVRLGFSHTPPLLGAHNPCNDSTVNFVRCYHHPRSLLDFCLAQVIL